MDAQKEARDRAKENSENRGRQEREEGEILDDELEGVVGGWSTWDTAQQSNQGDWVW